MSIVTLSFPPGWLGCWARRGRFRLRRRYPDVWLPWCPAMKRITWRSRIAEPPAAESVHPAAFPHMFDEDARGAERDWPATDLGPGGTASRRTIRPGGPSRGARAKRRPHRYHSRRGIRRHAGPPVPAEEVCRLGERAGVDAPRRRAKHRRNSRCSQKALGFQERIARRGRKGLGG